MLHSHKYIASDSQVIDNRPGVFFIWYIPTGFMKPRKDNEDKNMFFMLPLIQHYKVIRIVL